MTDALLYSSDQKEALSRVYAQAVASRAGYTTAAYNFDRHGIDLRIQAGGEDFSALELQLKATSNLRKLNNGDISFALPRRNYDLLISVTGQLRLLVVLDLPQDEHSWMSITYENLILRRCAYWVNLRGFPDTTNTSSVSVHIPADNLFNVDSLKKLMTQARTELSNDR